MGDPPRGRRKSLVEAFFVSALLVATLCAADADAAVKEKTVAVVGAGECADCASRNIKDADVFQGLHVAINCKAAGEREYQTRGVANLDKDGKFTVNLPSELLKEDGQLKTECLAQLHGGPKKVPCPSAAAGNVEAAKLVLKSKDSKGQHTFGTAGKLSFSSETCTAAWFWHHPWFKPVPKYPYPYPPKPYFPPKVYPPVYKPPLTPVYSPPPVYQAPPVYQPPVYSPPPVYKPPPVYNPPVYQPPPVYHPPVYSPPPVYKPPPVYNPPVYQPPVYSPPPVYKPPPVYNPPVYQPPPVYSPPPFYKPPCPPIYVYKPPIPKLPPFPPVYTKPWPTVPKFPPVYVKPLPPIPQLPPKYFYPHPKFGYPPSYGWPPKSASPTYTLPKHPLFPPSKVGKPKP